MTGPVTGAGTRPASTTWRARDASDGDAPMPHDTLRRRSSTLSDAVIGGYSTVERKVDLQLQERHAGISEALAGYNSPMNVLLVFVPLGILAGFLDWSQTLVFVFNFLGVIPLAMILGRATEDIASHTNQTIGGLINATFGNAVELVRWAAGPRDIRACKHSADRTGVGGILRPLLPCRDGLMCIPVAFTSARVLICMVL